MQHTSDENKEQFDLLVNERDELLKKNQELSNGLLNFDNKVKEANLIFINKTEFYNQSINAYKQKIKDYKNKISILKKKVNELYLIIEKMKLNGGLEYNDNLNKLYKNNLASTPGPYRHARGANISFSRRYFREKDDISLYNANKKNNISFVDDTHFQNTTHITPLNGIFKNNKINNDNDNGEKIYGDSKDKLDKLDYDQRKYLENYKSFLSGLDYQLSP